MRKLLITILFVSFFNVSQACENIRYQWIDSVTVSPKSIELAYISMMPYRGKFDYVRITANGTTLSPFEVDGEIWYNNGYEKDLWFDRSDDNRYPGIIADTRLHPYDRITDINLEISNGTRMLRFYDIHAGKCL